MSTSFLVGYYGMKNTGDDALMNVTAWGAKRFFKSDFIVNSPVPVQLFNGSKKPPILVGKDGPRLPNTSCLLRAGWKGETQVMQMDLAGYAISAGSACSSGKVTRSHVLDAMGVEDHVSEGAIRLSLGWQSRSADGAAFVNALKQNISNKLSAERA